MLTLGSLGLVLLLCLVTAVPRAAADVVHRGPPARADVLDIVARDLSAWRAKLPPARPRLYFDAESWRSLRQRYDTSTGLERHYFDAVLSGAATVAASPVPHYSSPDEVSRETGLSPFEAEQELWMRSVGNNMVTLSLALRLRDDPAVRRALHDTVVDACAYPQWGMSFNAPSCDLAAGHIGRGIAVAYDWHYDLWTEAERQTIKDTIRTRMNAMNAAGYGSIFWAGKYAENHNNVDMAAVGLCGLAFFDEIPEAPEWTAHAFANFERVAAECNADGSSEEGVPYWSYGMSFTLQYLEGVRHLLDTRKLYNAPYFRNSIATRLHASTPDLAGTAPWGDAVPRDYYGPHQMLYRLADEYHDGAGQYLANHLPFTPGNGDGDEDVVWTALWYNPALDEKTPAELDHLAEVAGTVSSRGSWAKDDYQLCVKAGFTNRNHSHLDAGALAFAFGHEWLLTTPGYGRGKGDPQFWETRGGRWNYFSNATESHCTLLIDGKNQKFDPDARGRIESFDADGDFVKIGCDLTGAYDAVTRVRRDVIHRRGEYVLVVDEIEAPAAVTAEWLAQVPPAAKADGGRLAVVGKTGRLDVEAILPADATFAVRNPTSKHVDVSPERLKTYATRQTGKTLRFATLLVPSRNAESPPRHEPTVVETTTDGRLTFTVTGQGWQDEIVVDAAAGADRLTATRRLPVPSPGVPGEGTRFRNDD